MNLGINKVESHLIKDALIAYFKSTKVPNLLLDCYPGADLECLFNQLNIICQIGEEPDERKIDWLEEDN